MMLMEDEIYQGNPGGVAPVGDGKPGWPGTIPISSGGMLALSIMTPTPTFAAF